ncbi:MAG: hypothetical protein ACPGJS_11500 [Flammeovirgaceae bacterium]
MNTFTLLNLVLNPEKAGEQDLEALEELIQEYPYFQAAHLLIAKITGNSAHIKRAAAYSSERSVLMRVINSDFNSDINLPNIDNLEIGKDDLSIFDKLEKEDSSEELILDKDDDFNDSFGEFNFNDEEEASPEDNPIEEPAADDNTAPIEFELPADYSDYPTDEEEEKEPSIADETAVEIPSIDLPDIAINDEEDESEETVPEVALPEVGLDVLEHITADPIDEGEEEDDDLMDELAELRRLQAEMEKSRKEAEEALKEEEERAEKEESLGFEETEYEYPDYALEENKLEETKEEIIDTTPAPIIEPEEEVKEETVFDAEQPSSVEPDDFSFFSVAEEQEAKAEESEEEKLNEVFEEESTEDTTEFTSGVFDFNDDTLFDLDALLAEEGQQIDAVKELENRPIAQVEERGVGGFTTLHAKQSDLINDFIEKSPSIKIPKDSFDHTDELKADLSDEQLDIPEAVSENLATIYVKQGKYGKAIEIYHQLMLKYPEKKAYFADLIDSLRNK